MENHKLNREFFIGLLKDASGYDSGFLKTSIDLIRKPADVLISIKSGDKTYVNPSRYLLTCCTYFILLNSFIIDWEATGIRFGEQLNELSGSEDADFLYYSQFAGVIMTTYLVPITLITVILKLIIIQFTTKKIAVTMSDHISVVFYISALSTLYTLWFSVLAASLNLIPFVIITNALFILYFLGFKKVFEPNSVAAFIPSFGKELRKKYNFSNTITILIISVLLGVYIAITGWYASFLSVY